jgi:hypothetical protein
MVGDETAPTVTSGSATVSSANAATYASFATSSLVLSNSNYTLDGGTVLATIDPAVLTAALTGAFSKTYDSTDIASGLGADNFLLTGWQGEDGAEVTETSGVFDDANAGTGKTITVTLAAGDFTASDGTILSNYVLPTSAQGDIGTIDQAILGVTAEKTYDGSNSFTTGFTLTGMVGDEAAPTVTGSATVASANAATYASFATNGLTLSDANYTLDGGTVLATIDPAKLGVTVTKTYDADNSFTTGFTFTGMVGDDAAPTVSSGSATVSSANAATYTSFTTNDLTLSDTNYTLDGGTVSATIAQKELAASLTGEFSRTYDGTRDVDGLSAANFELTGWVGDDGATVTETSGVFDDRNAATGKTITVTLASDDFTASGETLLSNYDLPVSAEGDIGTVTPKALDALKLSTPIPTETTPGGQPVNLTVSETLQPGTSGILEIDGPLTISGSALWDVNTAYTSVGDKQHYPVTLHPGEEQNLTLSGEGAGNYTLTGTSVTATLEQTPKPSVSTFAFKNTLSAHYQSFASDSITHRKSDYLQHIKRATKKKKKRGRLNDLLGEFSDDLDVSTNMLKN